MRPTKHCARWIPPGDGQRRRHLLNEDVLRFAAVILLEEHGVPASRIAVETPVPGPVDASST
jgi:hypothetical protein